MALALLVAVVLALPAALLRLDRDLPGKPFRNIWGVLRWSEDWSTAHALPQGLDNAWMLAQVAQAWRVAHALGASGRPLADSVAALEASQAAGLSLFEVDLWLDDQGHIRCSHCDDQGHAPPPYLVGDCTFETLLPKLATAPGWLVLDLKTDFEATGRRIVNVLRGQAVARQVVFQLYQPAHLALFAAWAVEAPLAAPIVTVYAAHRGVQHIASALQSLHFYALTLPLDKRQLLAKRPPGVALLVHPVHTCTDLSAATAWGAQGVYTLSDLQCP